MPPRDDFATHSPSELACSSFAARTNAYGGTGARQSKGGRPCSAPSAKNQHTAFAQQKLFLQRSQHSDVIRIAAIKRTIAAHYHRVHRSDFCRKRVAILQVAQNAFFVRQGDAKSAQAEVRCRL